MAGPPRLPQVQPLPGSPHRHSGTHQLQSRRDDLLTLLEAAFNDAFSFEHRASLELAAFEDVVGFNDEGVLHALLGVNDFVVDKRSAVRRCAGYANSREEAGHHERAPISKRHSGADRASSWIEPVIDEIDYALVWKVSFIPELDPRRHLGVAGALALALLIQLHVFQQAVLVGIDADIDRVDGNNRGQHALRSRSWLDKVAERNTRIADPPVDRRFDLGELQIQRGGIFRCFSRTRRGRSPEMSRGFLVELTGRDGVFRSQILGPVELNLRKF